MIKFNTTTKDKETGLEMILACCTYNYACAFLEKENKDDRFGQLLGVTGNKSFTEIVYKKARFLYDAERGVLLRED